MIKWIIQKTLAGEKTLDDLINAIEKSGSIYELIDLAPFSNEIVYKNIDDNKPIIYGSTTFMLLASQNNYLKTGVFFDKDKFLISEYINHWEHKVLNSDSLIVKAGDLNNLSLNSDRDIFVRPNEDTKALTGSIMKISELKNRINNVINENPYISDDTKLVLSSIKEIHKEWRNFIVNKKVISSCRYRHLGELSIDRNDTPEDMINFTENLCDIFTPHDVFVMDICEYRGKYFVVECNCFNGSGVYDNDLLKIVKEVNSYVINS